MSEDGGSPLPDGEELLEPEEGGGGNEDYPLEGDAMEFMEPDSPAGFASTGGPSVEAFVGEDTLGAEEYGASGEPLEEFPDVLPGEMEEGLVGLEGGYMADSGGDEPGMGETGLPSDEEPFGDEMEVTLQGSRLTPPYKDEEYNSQSRLASKHRQDEHEDEFGEDDGLDEFADDGFEEEEDQVNPLVELQEKYAMLQEQHERAMQTNVALQRRVIARRMQDKSYDASEKPAEGKVTEHRYQNNLQTVHAVRLKLRLQQVKAARMSEELKNQLEAKRQKAIECRDSFQEFKRQVARHAEYARTGRRIPEKILQEVEEFELDKDAEVEEVRGSNISLKNRLAKLEQLLRKKDELAENLHVIDFEQLKIENQTLNEKIEERNEELHKLRKKTVDTVQIITHMREKVQFVQREYQELKAKHNALDNHLATQRDLVARTKHERDEHRAEYGKLRQQTGIINSDSLTRDFEQRQEHIKQLKDDIHTLKKKHAGMLAFIKKHGGSL